MTCVTTYRHLHQLRQVLPPLYTTSTARRQAGDPVCCACWLLTFLLVLPQVWCPPSGAPHGWAGRHSEGRGQLEGARGGWLTAAHA
jgi:hypothetical protein